MRKIWPASIATRLALAYGGIAAAALAAAGLVFYLGTVGVLEHLTDAKLRDIAGHLRQEWLRGGQPGLEAGIAQQLRDKIDTDTELFLVSHDSRIVAGNLSAWPRGARERALETAWVWREQRLIRTRVLDTDLGGGWRLLVGRDLSELDSLQDVLRRALAVGLTVASLFAAVGAWWLRRAIERRVGTVRRLAHRVGEGDLAQRLPSGGRDEFSLLSQDINAMLARIESLMAGVQHVSNAIAHDLRTPLSRARNRLASALSGGGDVSGAAHEAIADIDRLTVLFEKLLRIAAAEAGMRPAYQELVDLGAVARTMAELYEAAAEECGQQLRADVDYPVRVRGDGDLLASALAGLLDNALKYAGAGAQVVIRTAVTDGWAELSVIDGGVGVPPAALPQLGNRFFRVEPSRTGGGNGIGLSNVEAIARLHEGQLLIRNRHPGLEVRLRFPLAAA
jgi:signal transduction histidine kinase